MAIFHYFSTFEESLVLLGDLCAAGFEVLPDRLYPSASATAYAAVTDELAALLKEGPGFYLRGAYTTHPVQFTKLRDDDGSGADRHVIDLLAQGPLLQGLCGRLNVVRGEPTLLLGDLSYQTEYRNPRSGAWEKAGRDVKAAHRQAVVTMKKRLLADPLAAGYVIGPQALELARAGRATLKTTALPPKRA